MQHYSHLKAYLDPLMPPMQVDNIIDTFQLLLDSGIDGHDYAIEQEMALAEEADTSIFTQSITNLAVDSLLDSLHKLGVTPVENTSLYDLHDLFRGLMTLDNYGDPESILQAASNDEGPVIALAEILPLVGRGTVGHYLHILGDVNPSLLERIEEVAKGQQLEQPAYDAQKAVEARVRLMAFAQQVGSDALLGVSLVRAGMRLGMPLEGYLDVGMDKLEESLRLSPSTLSDKLLSVILASEIDASSILQTGLNELEALVSNPEQLALCTKAYTARVSQLSYVPVNSAGNP